MRKKCIFCQRNDQKITREHVFPNWLSRLYGDKVKSRNVGTNADGTIVYDYFSTVFQQTMNVVCADCNHGWMSDIENQAKPILIKMLKNKSLTLDKKKQQIIATWAMKTILVLNHNNPAPPEKPYIPTAQYETFYASKKVEAGNVMLLGYKPTGKFQNGDNIASNRIDMARNVEVPKDMAKQVKKRMAEGGKIFGATLNLANIVFQLSGNDLVDGSTHRVEMLIPPEPLRVLNPYKNKIWWPLRHSIDEVGGLDVVHNALT
jgi:hypothetical protein